MKFKNKDPHTRWSLLLGPRVIGKMRLACAEHKTVASAGSFWDSKSGLQGKWDNNKYYIVAYEDGRATKDGLPTRWCVYWSEGVGWISHWSVTIINEPEEMDFLSGSVADCILLERGVKTREEIKTEKVKMRLLGEEFAYDPLLRNMGLKHIQTA